MRAALALLAVLSGCAAPTTRPVELRFAGEVLGEPFESGRTYAGVGTTETSFTAGDFRLFVHDVRVVTEDGAEIPLALDDDGEWQDGDVALLDFEDGTGVPAGDARLRTAIRGTVPIGTPSPTGVRFVVGVPAERNHVDGAAQPPPLNLGALFWGWQAGYDFLRVSGTSPGRPRGFEILLGAMGCSGDARMGTRLCTIPNRPAVALDGDVEHATITADLGRLFSAWDVETDGGGVPGCMSDEGDPDCEPLFDALGLGDAAQRFFGLRPD